MCKSEFPSATLHAAGSGVSAVRNSLGSPPTRRRSSSASTQDDRTRMECNVCGYKCVPQWLNDEAHCLKCQAVLKRRPSCHERAASPAALGRSSLRPVTPPTRQRSKSLSSVGAIGPERFFYDKSTYTGSHAHGRAVEDSMTRSGAYSALLSISEQNKKTDKTDDRARMECGVCGYKCVPQWLNDEAHCLKCQAVLKRRPSCHEKSGTTLARSSQRRASTPAKISDKISSRPLVGPERFFYDKTTYTGVHLRGGPC